MDVTVHGIVDRDNLIEPVIVVVLILATIPAVGRVHDRAVVVVLLALRGGVLIGPVLAPLLAPSTASVR